MSLELQAGKIGDVAVVEVQCESLDAATVIDFREAIQPIIDKNPNIVINIGMLRTINSSGLGALISCLKQSHERGGDLKLAGMKGEVKRIFEIVQIHMMFDLFDTTEEAVSAFSPG